MSTEQKTVLSLYALPDGGDHNAADIDTPDWESSVLYEKDQAKNAFFRMTHAVAWAILGDFSEGYAVAYWNLDEEGYSACAGIRTIKYNDVLPDSAALLPDADLAALAQRGTALRTKIAHHSREGGLSAYLHHHISNAPNPTEFIMAEAGDTLEALLDTLPALVYRVQVAETRVAQYPTQWAYEQACAALEKHKQRADAAEARLPRWVPIAEWEKVNHVEVRALWVLHKGWNLSEVYWDAIGQFWRRESDGDRFPHEVLFVAAVPAMPALPVFPSQEEEVPRG